MMKGISVFVVYYMVDWDILYLVLLKENLKYKVKVNNDDILYKYRYVWFYILL